MIRVHSINRETIISSVILLVLALIVAAVAVKQTRFDLSRYGLVTGEKNMAAPQVSTKPGENTGFDTDSLVPPAFKVLSGAERYDAGTLYEKINGKAPLYLTSGFRGLVTRRYMHEARKELWIEVFVYDMGSFDNAFSVFSQQKRADGRERPGVPYSYVTDNSEVLVRDRYYIEIVGSMKAGEITRGTAEIARMLRERLGSAKSINVLDYIKGPELITRSEIFYLRDAFGMLGLSGIYSAKYRIDGAEVTVFISGPHGADKRKGMIDSYSAFLLGEGAVAVKNEGSVEGMVLLDLGGYFEAMFQAGQFVAGVHEAETKEAALRASRILYGNILKNSGER